MAKLMKSPLDPYDIRVLLHCHTDPSPIEDQDRAPVTFSSLAMFEACGMVELLGTDARGLKSYITTPKGIAFVRALLGTREPIPEWRVPNAGEMV